MVSGGFVFVFLIAFFFSIFPFFSCQDTVVTGNASLSRSLFFFPFLNYSISYLWSSASEHSKQVQSSCCLPPTASGQLKLQEHLNELRCLSAGSVLGKQNLQALLADLKFSSRNVSRADRATPGQWEGIPGAELLEWLPLPSLPGPTLPGPTCAFPSSTAPVVLSHTEIWGLISPHGVCWWSCSSEPVGHLDCPSKPCVGTLWSLLNLLYQFKLRKCLTEQGKKVER